MKNNRLVAKTSFGFEELLVEELKLLGATNLEKSTRAVYFDGDKSLMYKANLWSRLALRILKPIAEFPAANEQELYDGIKKIDWSFYLGTDDTLAVDAVVSRSNLTHSLYVALKTKDAVVDQFRDKTGKRPDVDTSHPTIRIHVHLGSNIASVSLDSSGESLHKRGYRQQQGEAPLNESLAAGMVMLSGWNRTSALADLMCGSATILIEAALLARNIAPGLLRNEFAFERWNDFDSSLWQRLRTEAEAVKLPSLDFKLFGVDRSFEAIRNAKENISLAGVQGEIELYSMQFEDYTPSVTPSTIITNPPYGGRISDDDLFSLYKELGDAFKKKYPGCTAWVLTANKEAAAKIGLKPSRKIPLFNGALECRFLKFELYSGSKRIKSESDKIVSD